MKLRRLLPAIPLLVAVQGVRPASAASVSKVYLDINFQHTCKSDNDFYFQYWGGSWIGTGAWSWGGCTSGTWTETLDVLCNDGAVANISGCPFVAGDFDDPRDWRLAMEDVAAVDEGNFYWASIRIVNDEGGTVAWTEGTRRRLDCDNGICGNDDADGFNEVKFRSVSFDRVQLVSYNTFDNWGVTTTEDNNGATTTGWTRGWGYLASSDAADDGIKESSFWRSKNQYGTDDSTFTAGPGDSDSETIWQSDYKEQGSCISGDEDLRVYTWVKGGGLGGDGDIDLDDHFYGTGLGPTKIYNADMYVDYRFNPEDWDDGRDWAGINVFLHEDGAADNSACDGAMYSANETAFCSSACTQGNKPGDASANPIHCLDPNVSGADCTGSGNPATTVTKSDVLIDAMTTGTLEAFLRNYATTTHAFCPEFKVEARLYGQCGDAEDYDLYLNDVRLYAWVDWVEPTTSISPNGSSWTASDVAVTLTPTDTRPDTSAGSVARTCYSIINDGSACPAQSSTCTGWTQGTSFSVTCTAGTACRKRVCQYSVDDVGNMEATNTSNIFYIDKLAPTASINTYTEDTNGACLYALGSGGYYSSACTGGNTQFTVRVNASDADSGLDRADSQNKFTSMASNPSDSTESAVPNVYDLVYTTASSDNNSGTFTIRVYDAVGNTVDTTFTVTPDKTNPTCSGATVSESSNYLYATGGTLYYSNGMGGTPATFTLSGTASDAGAGPYQATFSTAFGDSPGADVGPANWASDTPGPTYGIINTDSGSPTITVTVYDNVNNSCTASVNTAEDLSAPAVPTVTLTADADSGGDGVAPDSGYYDDTSVDFSWSTPADAGAGVLDYLIGLGSCGTQDSASPGTSTAGGDGAYTINVCGRDNVYNVGSAGTASVTVDTTLPTFSGLTSVKSSGNAKVKLAWSAGSDTNFGTGRYRVYRCTPSCAAPGSYLTADADDASPHEDTGLTDSTQYCYTVRAKDRAGNIETNTVQTCITAIKANETVAGTVVGYPASAFNGTSQYVGTYVAANSTWLYLLDANGTEIDSVNLGAGNTIAGVPASVWDGSENVVYVATASGKLFKLKNVDGAPAGDPAGNELCDPGESSGCTFSGTEHKLVDVCTDGSPAATQLTTRPIGDANAMWMAAVDPDCPTPERVVAVETTANAISVNGTVDVATDFAACVQTQISSTPKVVAGAGWSATQVHVGSDCPGAANNVKLYRIDADVGNSDCAKDVLGTDIRAWVTGAFDKLYLGTVGAAAATRGFYVVDKYGGSGVCGTDVYETLAGFPYQGPATDIGSVSRGASVNWNSEQDEVYFGSDDGKLHCVCTTTSVQGGNSCVIAAADRCDGTPGVGQACTGFPVTLETGVALREPLIKDGTIYIASATGKIYAVEPLCDEGGADGTASGTVKGSNGFTFTLDTTGVDSSVSALDTGGPVRIMVGTNTGRVFYLPVAP